MDSSKAVTAPAETNAIPYLLNNSQFTAHRAHYPQAVLATWRQSTYAETALGIEILTRVHLGGDDADLQTKANLAYRSLQHISTTYKPPLTMPTPTNADSTPSLAHACTAAPTHKASSSSGVGPDDNVTIGV